MIFILITLLALFIFVKQNQKEKLKMPKMPKMPKIKVPSLPKMTKIKIPKMKSLGKVGDSVATGAKKAGKAVSEGASKAASYCKKNPKTCAAGVAAAGVTGWAIKKYGDLKEDQKNCLALCYPEDWPEYIDGKIDAPNYKVIDGSSNIDDTKYAAYYPDMAENLCTPENLKNKNIPEGKKSCNSYCEKVCDFDLTDVASEMVEDTAKGVGKIGGAAAKGLLDGTGISDILGNYGLYIGGACGLLCCLVLFLLLATKMG